MSARAKQPKKTIAPVTANVGSEAAPAADVAQAAAVANPVVPNAAVAQVAEAAPVAAAGPKCFPIATARVKNIIEGSVNSALNVKINAIETAMAALGAEQKTEDPMKKTYSSGKVRFGGEFADYASVLLELITRELLTCAFNNAVAAGSQMVNLRHLFGEQDPKSGKCAAFYAATKSFREAWGKHHAAQHTDAMALLTEKVRKDTIKIIKETYSDQLKGIRQNEMITAQVAAAPVAAAEVAEVAAVAPEAAVNKKEDFDYYICGICRLLVGETEKFKRIRVSAGLKLLIEKVLVEICHRLSGYFIMLLSQRDSKTIDHETFLNVVELIMNDSADFVDNFTLKDVMVHDPAVIKAKKEEHEKDPLKTFKMEDIPKINRSVVVHDYKFKSCCGELVESIRAKVAEYNALLEAEAVTRAALLATAAPVVASA